MGLYPSIPHNFGLRALKETLKIPTEDLLQMAEFVFKNNFFEFNNHIKQQISGTAIGTKCAPTYACIFMDKVQTRIFRDKQINHSFGLDILMIFSSFGCMVKKSYKYF